MKSNKLAVLMNDRVENAQKRFIDPLMMLIKEMPGTLLIKYF